MLPTVIVTHGTSDNVTLRGESSQIKTKDVEFTKDKEKNTQKIIKSANLITLCNRIKWESSSIENIWPNLSHTESCNLLAWFPVSAGMPDMLCDRIWEVAHGSLSSCHAGDCVAIVLLLWWRMDPVQISWMRQTTDCDGVNILPFQWKGSIAWFHKGGALSRIQDH